MEISTATKGDLTYLFTAIPSLNIDDRQYYDDYVISEIECELLTHNSPIKKNTCPFIIIINEETKADDKIKQILELVLPTYNETLEEIPEDSVLVLYTSAYTQAASILYKMGSGIDTFTYPNDPIMDPCSDIIVELVKMNLLDLLKVTADAYDFTFNHIRSSIRDFMTTPEVLFNLKCKPEVTFFNDHYSHYVALIAFVTVPALFRDNYIRVLHDEHNPLKDVCLIINDEHSDSTKLKAISFKDVYNDVNLTTDKLENYHKAVPLSTYIKTHFNEISLLQMFMK